MLVPTTSKPDARGGLVPPTSACRWASIVFAVCAAGLPSCSAEPVRVVEPVPPPKVSPEPVGDPVSFVFDDTSGKSVSAESLRGRITVVLLITTYDVESQAMVQMVAQLTREHTPRINAIALVLEVERNRGLVNAFASGLEPGYPVALAAESWIRGDGAFPGLRSVPSVVVLDREGREAARFPGFMKKADIDALVRQVEARDP